MASSSTSSIHKSFKYDVFLSFRGEDVRKNFVDHLFYALQHKGIHTYKDDETIKKGKRISDELIKSIEDSRFHIIVFSKNYASSSWCLDELVKIMQCQKMTKQTAYPVFYDVEPTDVRKQRGAVGEAFAEHKKEEAAGKWIEALEEAADLAGWELKNTTNGYEAKFIQKIVEEILLELRSINFNVDGKLIGMDTRIEDVVSSLEIGFDDVRMIGIKGMGGGGKTTLARAIFDQISFMFEGRSFVENIREVSKSSLFGLKTLQKQVISDVFNDHGITVSSVYDGKILMKNMMCNRKVLVVLDDVDHIEQLEALAGDLNWFKGGSRIIITTRDEQVLVAHRVNSIRNVSLLSHKEAICLFSRYAFGIDIPIQGYNELSRQVVRYAAGLPLTIRVLGSFLCGKNELEWKDALERLRSIPLKETSEKLELSYIDLEEDYKEIFLDVACILKGWTKDDAIRALESCGFHARNGLRVLQQKSLITISILKYDGKEYLGMHDHIEEMGRNIVRRLHPDEPHEHSRLWIEEEIVDVLANRLGTKATRCMNLQMRGLNPEIVMQGLGNMKKLRFLDVYPTDHDSFPGNWKFDNVSQYFPNSLQCLNWYKYPFRSLPITFEASNLVQLEMPCSRIVRLWEDGERKVLNKLRFLDLSHTKLQTLDLGMASNLETLILRECHDLVEFHVPIGCLKLEYIDIRSSKLRTLDFCGAPNLKTCLLRCVDLVELHMPVEYLKLRSLDLNLSKLKTLDLRGAPNLEILSLEKCDELVTVHMPPIKCLKLRFLDLSHSKLRTLDLGLTPNLQSLHLSECHHLVELHTPVGCLEKLAYLDLSGFLRFKSFCFRKQFKSLEVGSLCEIHLIVESLDICPLHANNNLPKFRFTCSYEHVPSSFQNLEKLIFVGLCACTNLKSFSQSICGLQCVTKLTLEGSFPEVPKDLDRLECLEELSLSSTEIEHLPDSICMLKNLKSLKLKFCCLLEKLPEDLGRLECLEKLILEFTSLRDIPTSICNMKCLKYFRLLYCVQLEKLPEELGRLECLKELNIQGSGISYLPHSVFTLKGLRIVASRLLLQSCGFTSEIQISGNETFCYI